MDCIQIHAPVPLFYINRVTRELVEVGRLEAGTSVPLKGIMMHAVGTNETLLMPYFVSGNIIDGRWLYLPVDLLGMWLPIFTDAWRQARRGSPAPHIHPAAPNPELAKRIEIAMCAHFRCAEPEESILFPRH